MIGTTLVGASGVLSPAEICAATFGTGFVSGFLPLVNIEVYLVAVSAISAPALTLPLTLAATLGQMAAKVVICLSGRGVLRLPLGRYQARLTAVRARFERHQARSWAFMFLSALGGFPPFYIVSFLAGTMRVSWVVFLSAGFLGRFLRFGSVALLPQLVGRFWR